ncbi:MAG: helix-turn-helix domain-containing protein, partial [Gemmatimonadales bacterium]|nr:helix-turn-helix domain-containing protein [Gemmatimonadales bacterium]
MPEVMTATEVATRYRCSVWSIYKYAKQGTLPSRKLGAKILFYRD